MSDPASRARRRAAVAVVGQVAAGFPGADPGHPAPGRANRRRCCCRGGFRRCELDPAGRSPGWPVADGRRGRIRCGASLGYLAGLAAFARELVERGRVLPELRARRRRPMACWRPALQGPDVVAIGALVTRDAAGVPGRTRPGRTPTSWWLSRCTRLVDAAARDRRCRGSTWCRRGAAGVRNVVPAVEAWLTALTASGRPVRRGPRRTRRAGPGVAAVGRTIGTGRVGPARATFRFPRPSPETDDRETSAGSSLAAGVPAAVDGGPQPAGARRAGVDDDGSLRRWLDRPQELLLTELGRASRIYPGARPRPAHRRARPRSTLDADGAYRFLSVVGAGAGRGRLRRAAAVVVGPAPQLGLKRCPRTRRSTGW